MLANFWATWCAPCRDEMPSLLRLAEQRAAAGLLAVGVNYKESAGTVRRFLDGLGLNLTVLLDSDGSVATAWTPRIFPSTLVFDRRGRPRGHGGGRDRLDRRRCTADPGAAAGIGLMPHNERPPRHGVFNTSDLVPGRQPMTAFDRRQLLGLASGLALAPLSAGVSAQERRFQPRPGDWRRFEITTTVELQGAQGAARIWVPVPSVDAEYQRTFDTAFTGNASRAVLTSDTRYGARMVMAEFAAGTAKPTLQVDQPVRDPKPRNRLGPQDPGARRRTDPALLGAAHRTDAHRRHRARHRARDRRQRAHPMSTRCSASTTGSSRTPTASPRCAAVAWVTSRPCWRPATWAASAATSMRCSSACHGRPACPRAMCTASAWCRRPLATANWAATRPA